MKNFQIKLYTVPNLITLLNLLSGCLAVVCAFYGQLLIAASLIFAAGIFDFLDGMVARLLKSYSELGKQLDSLADMVSFGVAPSVIIFNYYQQAFHFNNLDFSFIQATFPQMLLLVSAFIIALFSALRLAKFNIDDRQSESFIGVPTPAVAFLIASLPFVTSKFPLFEACIASTYFLFPLTILLSGLLVSEIPLISLKFKTLKFSDNKPRYLLLGTAIPLLVIFQIAAFPVIFLIYLTISILGRNKKV